MSDKHDTSAKPTTEPQGSAGRSVKRLVGRRPLPPEVKEIMGEVSRLQYRLLVEAGWCVSCYRERAAGTTRCAECNEIASRRAEARARRAGIKPWKAGGRGRKPKSSNDKLKGDQR